jgi:guanylate kinase
VGKTTIMKRALAMEPSLHFVKGEVSRAPRPGERDGLDYHFRTTEEMLARVKKGSYVQVAPRVLDALYATAPEDYSTEGVAIYAVVAQAIPTFRALPFKKMQTVFVIPPDWKTWQQRLAGHRFNAEQTAQRLAEAKKSLAFALEDTQITFIVNEDVDTAAQDFVVVALDKPCPGRLQADQVRAPAIVHNLLRNLH